MNYVKTHTRTDGLEVLFTETVSKVDVNNQSITFDGLPPTFILVYGSNQYN